MILKYTSVVLKCSNIVLLAQIGGQLSQRRGVATRVEAKDAAKILYKCTEQPPTIKKKLSRPKCQYYQI